MTEGEGGGDLVFYIMIFSCEREKALPKKLSILRHCEPKYPILMVIVIFIIYGNWYIGSSSTNQPSAAVQGSNPTLRDTGRDVSMEGRVVPEFLPQKENSVIRGIFCCFKIFKV